MQKEKTIGTMHETRQLLGDLVINLEGKRVVDFYDDEWGYFDAVWSGDVEVVNRAIEIFLGLDAREVDFWAEFNDRVSSSLAANLDREIEVRLRADRTVRKPSG